jgi:chromosomal replication initiator protein
MNVAQQPGTNYNPLYIYSRLSFGKTHILNAVGNLALQNNPSTNIIYLSADRFVNEVSSTPEPQQTHPLWETSDTSDFLLVDDIHLLAEHYQPQTELLALFNSLLESNGQLVVTSAYPPGKIRNLLPQLRSRLEWGLIAEIHPPDQRTKVKIIKKMARNQKLTFPDDVSFFLANSTDDMKTISRNIVTIKEYVSSYRNPIDISTVESIIKKTSRSTYIDINYIQSVTAKYFNISLSDLLSDKRERAFSYPRQAAMYLTKQLTPLSLKEIGSAFGNKHHSTVIYAEKSVRKARTQNERVSRDIDAIQKLLV